MVEMSAKLKQPVFSPNALTVLEKRYLQRDAQGRVVETPRQLLERVAGSIGGIEKRDKPKWSERFYSLMASRKFLPNTPTLMNAGKKEGQLSACFVLPIGDSLEGIFDTLKNAALIHQSGGGTGFSFSSVRAKGSEVGSSHGVASGPVSFMRIFDVATETIKQGGARRGANMAVLRVDHPDIFEFIDSKTDQSSVLNFNISVGLTSEFMAALRAGGRYPLRNPVSGKPTHEVEAREVFQRIVRAAWACGDPGLVFLDRMNLFNPTPEEGEFESTNPCGEQPLLAFESCNLGSLNLGEYVRDGRFHWEELGFDAHAAVRFLDNVIDRNAYPVSESARITLRNRKIGLGVMGFADALLMLGIPYGSAEGRAFGEQVMGFIDREAKRASMALARERGRFPNWNGSIWQRMGYPAMRNATVSTVAPTGTISIIAGASSGIEPIFSGVFHRNVLGGERLIEIHPTVRKLLETSSFREADLDDGALRRLLGPAWAPARAVSVEDHVWMQAVFQRHSDSAVSKTINLPETATVADVERAYLLAYDLGCKGITVYRDKSRREQVLDHVICRNC